MFLLTIYLPWLLNMLPYSYWALTCLAVLPTYSAFMISVRQASDLPPASFRFPVTQDTLALGYILPAVGRIGDFHPLKHAPAGRTKKAKPVRHSAHPLRCIVKKALLSNPLKIAVMMSCPQVTPIDFSVPCAFTLNRMISHVSAHQLCCSEKRDSVKPFLPSGK